MLYPHTVTVINRIPLGKGKFDYKKTVVKNVFYQDTQRVTISAVNHFDSTQGYVQLPLPLEGYIDALSFKNLEDKSSNWTIQKGDYIVKGEYKGDIEKDRDELRIVEAIETQDYSLILNHFIGITLK